MAGQNHGNRCSATHSAFCDFVVFAFAHRILAAMSDLDRKQCREGKIIGKRQWAASAKGSLLKMRDAYR
jgi:hypothetical protein